MAKSRKERAQEAAALARETDMTNAEINESLGRRGKNPRKVERDLQHARDELGLDTGGDRSDQGRGGVTGYGRRK